MLKEQLFQRQQRLVESGHLVELVLSIRSMTFGALIAPFAPPQDAGFTPIKLLQQVENIGFCR